MEHLIARYGERLRKTIGQLTAWGPDVDDLLQARNLDKGLEAFGKLSIGWIVGEMVDQYRISSLPRPPSRSSSHAFAPSELLDECIR